MRMKKLIALSMVLLLASCSVMENKGEKVKAYIDAKDCVGAENYARNMLSNEGEKFGALGVVYVDCYRKRSQGIEYLNIAARQGNAMAIDALIYLGEKPPAKTQPSPLQACLAEVNRSAAMCGISALGSGNSFNDAKAQNNSRTCEDRKLSQEDRCYARFK